MFASALTVHPLGGKQKFAGTLTIPLLGGVSSLLTNAWFAAWGHAAYKISSEIGINCRPGALTGLLFQRAPRARIFGPGRSEKARS